MERRQRSIDFLFDSKALEVGRPETYWVDLDVLTQEHLDDITAIYCQVFHRSPEFIGGSLELEPLVRDITIGLGYHEAQGFHTPGLDVRRIPLEVVAKKPKFAVRFGASHRGEAFQKAVDEYLRDSAQIAKSLSQINLEEKTGPLFSKRDQIVKPNPQVDI